MARPWAVGPDGAGPLRIGMSLARLSTALSENVTAPDPAQGADSSGQCFYITSATHPELQLMILRGQLARIDVFDPGVETDRGIHVGSKVDAVRRAYGPQLVVEPNAYDADERYLTRYTNGHRRGIRFETREGKVGSYYAGTAEAIRLIEGCA